MDYGALCNLGEPSVKRLTFGVWLGLIWMLALTGCGSSAKPSPGMGCTLNSDCASGLVCTFGLCHVQCTLNTDCPTGELCVKSGTLTSGGASINVCQLQKESTCVYNSQCTPLRLARDQMCRNECVTSADCISPQVCTDSKVCALASQLVPGTNDVRLVSDGGADAQGGAGGSGGAGGAAGSSNAGGAGGAAAAGGKGGGAGAGGGSACTGPQLQFNNVSQGDANAHFTSAV